MTIVPFALGEVEEEISFYEPPDSNTGTGSFVKDFKQTENKGLKLQVKNSSQMFEELGIKTASVIKLDVEGFEVSVLKGLLPFLENQKPVIIMEFSPDTEKLLKQTPKVQEFLKKNYSMSIFKNPNSLNYKLLPWNFDRFGDVVFTPN